MRSFTLSCPISFFFHLSIQPHIALLFLKFWFSLLFEWVGDEHEDLSKKTILKFHRITAACHQYDLRYNFFSPKRRIYNLMTRLSNTLLIQMWRVINETE